ncbi:MAG: cation diffusion facilitator family transporter [Gammaproteobacteria bacterium]|nr:cation transporter [Pseudomonadales bacterium]MCP5346378.1 cation transporter [Pseudomonadales bacterium]
MNELLAKKEAARVTLVGMWLDLVLGALKIAGGALSGSFALVSDGIHSLTDAASDIFVLVISHFSHDAPDNEHPYGHGRFETIGTVVMGMLFFAIAAVLLYDSYLRLIADNSILVPSWGGVAIAALSIAGKEWIYHYTMRTARRLNSSLLRANAWHSRSDAISSIAVMIGILGALQGFLWLDLVAAMFVAVIIAKIGWGLCLDSLKELVDTAIPQEHQDRIRASILEIPGINRVTSLRSRQSGGRILLEVQIEVDPRISVSEGHQLGEVCSRMIKKKYRNISHVMVHIDPESHTDRETQNLPLRDEIVSQITDCWASLLDESDIRNIDLHYLGHGIEVDLYLLTNAVDSELARQLVTALQSIPSVKRLKIYNNILETSLTEEFS